MDKKLIKELLKHPLADRSPGYVEETLESAGCTGGCEYYDEDGLPDCERCSQFKKEGQADVETAPVLKTDELKPYRFDSYTLRFIQEGSLIENNK